MEAFCVTCNDYRSFRVGASIVDIKVHGVDVKYLEQRAYCNCCANELYVAEINDRNCVAANNAYRRAIT